jgi:hypothetical protein
LLQYNNQLILLTRNHKEPKPYIRNHISQIFH